MTHLEGYTQQEWDRAVGWGPVPEEYRLRETNVVVLPQQPPRVELPPLAPYTESELSRMGCSPAWSEQHP